MTREAEGFRIVGWDKWQSYRKDRGQPPWIKVHRRLLRNPKWVSLSDSERGQLVAMWLLSADHDGVMLASPGMIAKLCFMSDPPDINKFIDLGLIEPLAPQHDATVTPERRQHDAPEVGQSQIREDKKEGSHLSACADPPASLDRIPNRMVADWNQLAEQEGLPKVAKLTAGRRAAARKRWADAGGEAGWVKALEAVKASPFLLGKNDRDWRANFDFLMRESSFARLQEGAYNGSGKTDWSYVDDPE